jgi:hypothetical protein
MCILRPRAGRRRLLDNAARPSGAIVYKGGDGQGGAGADQYDRLVARWRRIIRARAMPGGRCCWKGGWTGSRWAFRPGHGVSEDQGIRGARDRHRLWRAADADGDSGGCDLCQLSGGEPGVLPPDGAAAGGKVTAAVAHWLSAHSGEAVELRPDLDQVPALAAERDQQWARVGAADFLTAAEKRAILGLPRLAEEE